MREAFDLIALREQSSRAHRERRARLRELTVEPEEKKLTVQEEMVLRLERAEKVLSELHPGSPSAVPAVCSCLLDVVDALMYCMGTDSNATTGG